ncbi:MAG: AAA family ATPase [Lachnospiraceae bacterium]|nr:AAA family ATPase [Lachnospiraceae bacterium]
MTSQLEALKNAKNYDEIIKISMSTTPAEVSAYEDAHAIGKAFEKKNAFSQCLPWYERAYAISGTDEALGMVFGIAFALGRLDVVEKYMSPEADQGFGYFYHAGKYQMAFRKGLGAEAEIKALEAFLDIQYEESYMLRLANLYVLNQQEKEAGRLCKKMGRLFINGETVDYAEALLEAIKEDRGLAFVQEKPWVKDQVFKHLSFDLGAPSVEDVHIDGASVETAPTASKNTQVSGGSNETPAQPSGAGQAAGEATAEKKTGLGATLAKMSDAAKAKKDDKEKIAPIIEKSLADVVGMQDLKVSMNNLFNMMQLEKKRVGSSILKNNIRIYGGDGCGKTTAALAATKTLAKLGIIGKDEPVITDYDSLIGADPQATADNIQQLFESAENACILIENIHEFDDQGAYGNGLNAIDLIVKAYEAAEEMIPLMITGSEAEVEALLDKKKKFADLFNLPAISVGTYTKEELVQIAGKITEEKNLILDDDVEKYLKTKFEHMLKEPDFKYSRDIDSMINQAYLHLASRISKKRRPSEAELYLLTVEDFDTKESSETVEELLQELDAMTGLKSVKEQVNKIVQQVRIQKMKEEAGVNVSTGFGSLHLVFLGNAGTGKTTVARIIGKIYKRLGVLPKGQLIECTRRDLVSEHVGGTALKVEAKVKEAMGGILFIDEAYSLCKDDGDNFGHEAIDALLADIENHRDSMMVILAGYSDDMNKFMDQNQGLRSRIPTDIEFEDYSVDEMVEIFLGNVKKDGLVLEEGLEPMVRVLIENAKKSKRDFGNARGVRNVFEAVKANQSVRLGEMDPKLLMQSKEEFITIRKADLHVPEEEVAKHKTVEDYLAELNALTGLTSVKEEVNKLVAMERYNKLMKERGLPTQSAGTLHMVFRGNAGTGKTTVARMLGNIYRELGVLSRGQVIECDRSALVGGYVGQTAPLVKAKVQEAMGGVLFIDEAYALASGDAFGQEAIDTLVADIENYRNDLMVIIAGYTKEMDHFLATNQGLGSRFVHKIDFEDYTLDEMLDIFKNNIKSAGLILEEGTDDLIKALIEKRKAAETDFANARGVRNTVQALTTGRTLRITSLISQGKDLTTEELQTVTREDIENCMNE